MAELGRCSESVAGCGGRRWLAVAVTGHGSSAGDGMVAVAGWSCPPRSPSTWMVAVGVDHRLRARLLSLFRSC
jgi:hypothetical protein